MYAGGVGIDLPPLRRIDLDGPVAYREWDGPGDTTFVLVHGLGGAHVNWAQVAPGLAGLGRVLALDLPGFGLSPPGTRGSGLMDERRTLSRFVHELGTGRVVLGGNSMGGAIAILEAAVEPDAIAGLILTGSAFPWAPGALPSPVVLGLFAGYRTPVLGERMAQARLRAIDPERAVRIGLHYAAARPSSIPEEIVQLHIDLLREGRDDPDIVPAFLDATRSMLRLARLPEVAARALDGVRCPVLVLHGRRDKLVPAKAAEAALASHPAWRGRFFPDLGHVPQMEDPGRWLTAVADWYAAELR